MFDLTGKVAVITGAGSGIGRGIALSLAEAGADIVASDLFMDRAGETAELVREQGRKAVAQRTDVREQESVQALAEAAIREFGRLDICIANAGIARAGSVLTLPLEDWQAVVDVNQTGVFLTVQACSREMVRLGNGGRVIVISSMAAEVAQPGWGIYATAKAAVRHAARCWALDLAPFNITVNTIGPGWIDTKMTTDTFGEDETRAQFEARIALQRIGRPEDVGAVAAFLASDEAAYVSGSFQTVDGGAHDVFTFAPPVLSDVRETVQQYHGDALLAEIDRQAEERRDHSQRRRRETGVM